MASFTVTRSIGAEFIGKGSAVGASHDTVIERAALALASRNSWRVARFAR